GAGVTRGSPSDRLDDESGAVVHRRTRRLTVATAVAAHLIGTGGVLVLLVFVLPVPPEVEGWTPGSGQCVRRAPAAASGHVGRIERNTRSRSARALAGAPPRSYRVPGVATRALFAWALGTAVPVIGVVAIAAVSLALPVSAHRVAATALCLGVIALVVGLGAMVIFAQSISDPLRILRRALADVEAGSLEPRVTVDDGSEVGFLQAGFNRMVSGLR